MRHLIARLAREESAQGMAEYGLLVAFIALVALVAVQFLGTSVRDQLNNTANQLNTSTS